MKTNQTKPISPSMLKVECPPSAVLLRRTGWRLNVPRSTIFLQLSTCYFLLFLGSATAQTFTTLKHFARGVIGDGANPRAGLTLSGNTLYGTTESGGLSYSGTVFKMNTDGTRYTVLKHLDSFRDGGRPLAGLILSGSTLYGTTHLKDSSDPFNSYVFGGTVFKVNTNGAGFTVLKNFGFDATGDYDLEDGGYPAADLTLSGNTLYGTTSQDAWAWSGGGTVFRVNTDGTGYTVLKHLNSPYGGVTLSGGTLYGTTAGGGISNYGTVFKINTDGTDYTVLKHFTGGDERGPRGGLILSGSTLYGTTDPGPGWHTNSGTVFRINTDGTGYAVLKRFTGSDGRWPYAGVTLSGNTLYGTTSRGGNSNQGTVFQVNTDGTGFKVLKHFTGSDGGSPSAGVTLSGKTLYGTTSGGGDFGYGTVFRIDLPLTPAELVEQLIAQVNAAELQHKQPLLATLNAALASIERGNCHSAVGQLDTFQNKVGAQVYRIDPEFAVELIFMAEEIRTALERLERQ